MSLDRGTNERKTRDETNENVENLFPTRRGGGEDDPGRDKIKIRRREQGVSSRRGWEGARAD